MNGPLKPVFALDFDGTINTHQVGFTDPGIVADPPIRGALAFLTDLAPHVQIVIFSARAAQPEGVQAIVTWMNENGFALVPYTVTAEKPATAFAFFDDLGWNYGGGAYPTVEEVLAFRPWWKTGELAKPLPPLQSGSALAAVESLAARAAAMDEDVTDSLRRIVRFAGGDLAGLEQRLKTARSLAAKLAHVMAEKTMSLPEATADVKDALRYTAVFPTDQYLEGCAAVLRLLAAAGMTVTRLRNYWAPVGGSRYADGTYVGLNVVLAGLNGFPVELQFHTPQSLDAQAINWGFYRLLRSDAAPEDAAGIEAQMRQNNGFVPRPAGVDEASDAAAVLAFAARLRTAALLVSRGIVSRAELLRAAGLNDEDETETRVAVAAVAEQVQPDGGYGDTYWNPDTGAVFWVSADWTSNEETDAAREAFLAIPGVNSFDYDAEGWPSEVESKPWERVYPAALTAAAIPASANYRDATDLDRSCATCSYYGAGTNFHCGMWDAAVEPAKTCDEWAEGLVLPEVLIAAAAADTALGVHNRLLLHGYRRADDIEPHLARILEPILNAAGDEAARAFRARATDHLTACALVADADITPRSTMVAVYPRPDEAAQLAEAEGEDLDTLRVVQGNEVVAEHPLTGAPAVTAAAGPAPWSSPAPDELIDVAALVAKLRTKTDPVRLAVVEAMMTPALEHAGVSFDVTNPLTAKVLAQSASQVTSIAQTTQLNVMRVIRESYQQGLSIPDTASAIRAGMREASPARARLIARTELAGAVNGGSLAATQIVSQTTGDWYAKTWLTAPGAQYPRHEDYEGLDGQTVNLNDAFEVGDSQLQFPGDPDGPPEDVCNCRLLRCTMVYTDDAGQLTDAGDTIDASE